MFKNSTHFFVLLFLVGLHLLLVNAKLNLCLKKKIDLPMPQGDVLPKNSADPIFISNVSLTFNHPAIRLNAEFKNVSIWNTSYVVNTFFQNNQLVNLTFPNISLVGDYYSMKGNIGQLFDIFGEGDFWCYLTNFSVSFSILSLNLNTTDFCVPVSLDVDLQKANIHFNNLMDDPELCDLFNEGFCSLMPDIVKDVWEEAKEANDPWLEARINSILNSLLGRDEILTKLIENYLEQKLFDLEKLV
ncbi:unnamed protein product [Phyllotreta striolata]|uniref:Uncharacterized protein n=1 Tax=Phyllotreta striolata TaxID=444603 RepID=A0A9N9THN2_PHYSR|nr:unnamed protein product [Phyllotreta striolata]